jgi:hypothetical protein
MPEHAPTLGPAPTLAPIKPTKALTVHPRSLSSPPKRKFTRPRSTHGVPAIARAPTTVDRPLQPSSTPSNPSASLPRAQWSSPSPRTKHHIVGGARLTSLDFVRPPSHVDRAARWPTLRSLAPTAPLTSNEAPRAVWLNSTIVGRPEHASPTRPTACACSQPYSGHHRRRSTPRHDRQKPPDLTWPSTGTLPPLVSHATAFSLCGNCSCEEGARVKKGKKPGGYWKCQWLWWIVSQGHEFKVLAKENPRGPGAKLFFKPLDLFFLNKQYT